jgi:hypothetical protein
MIPNPGFLKHQIAQRRAKLQRLNYGGSYNKVPTTFLWKKCPETMIKTFKNWLTSKKGCTM